jgi:hypothetical protein
MKIENSFAMPAQAQSVQLFEKRTVAELTEDQMMAVDGGSTFACGFVAGVVATIIIRLV